MTKLLVVKLSSAEVRKLIDFADSSNNVVMQLPFETPKPPDTAAYKIKGQLNVDLRKAKPDYKSSRLSYGPVDVGIYFNEISVKFDWHRILGIPKKICLELKDPCGNVIFKECVNFDLGITTIPVYNIGLPLSKFNIDVLGLKFQDSGGQSYDLSAYFPIASQLFEIFVLGTIRAFTAQLGREVERLLRNTFGGGWLADRLIDIIKFTFKIIEKAFEFASKLIRDFLLPIEQLFKEFFGEYLHVTIKNNALPRQIPIISATAGRPAVYLPLNRPPLIHLRSSTIVLELIA